MLVYKDVLMGPLLALLASALVLAIPLLLRRGPSATGGAWGTLAVAAGYVAGYVATLGWPPFPPLQAVERLFCVVVAALAVSGAVSLLGWQGWRRGAIVSCLVLAAVAYVLLTRFSTKWTWSEAALLLGLGLAGIAFWATLDVGAAQGGGVSFCLALLVVVAGTAVVAGLSHSAMLGQLGGVLLAAFFPILAAAWRAPAAPAVRGAMMVLAVVLPGLWLSGRFFSDFPTLSIVMLAAAPAACFLGGLALPRRLALLRLVAPLLLVGAGVMYSHSGLEEEYDPYSNWSPTAASVGDSTGSAPASSATSSSTSAGADNNPFQFPSESSTPPSGP